ncbi:hypothetical protein N665_0360s0009, partial [Sinapis alba]
DVCILCKSEKESRDHIFFRCRFAAGVWSKLARKLMGSRFTTVWSDILSCLVDKAWSSASLFLLRYVFQATVYSIWRERNGRRHGEPSQDQTRLSSYIDKQVRNRIDSLRGTGNGQFDHLLRLWFANS